MPGRRGVLQFTVAAAGAVAPVLAGTAASAAAPESTLPARRAPATGARPGATPLVIAHRGASGYRPEHTLAGYELAARLGADFIEPDLVVTRDGVLVARHEPEISGTTDIATRPEFAGRRRTKLVDGTPVTGWFAEDLTLAELRTLRAMERLPQVRQHNTLYDGVYGVPTFAEVLHLRERLSAELGREIGVYPELKHPTYFRAQGLALEERLVRQVREAGLDRPDAPAFVQCFEAGSLRRLHERHRLRTPKIFLTAAAGAPFDDRRDYASYLTPAGLRELGGYVAGIGPDKNQVVPRGADGGLGAPSRLVADAHAAGLLVHPYTFRAENQFLPTGHRRGTDPTWYGRAVDELAVFLRAGVDGVFTDQPDVGVLARSAAGRG